jgi:hypothetical protein
MADDGITFKTFGAEGQAPAGDQQRPAMSNSFVERAEAIKNGTAAPAPGGAPNRATAFSQATLQNLSNGRAPQTDIPAADYAKMSWGEYAPIVASNVIPSSYEAVKGIANAVVHPIDTATAIGQLGTGLGTKAIDAAGNAVGYGPVFDPSKKAEREAVADALIQSYSGRYGGGEEGEFWKHLAEDPASYLSDIASVATAGAGAAGKLGIIDKAGKVAKAAELAGRIDPIQAAVVATGKALPAVGRAVPYGLMGAQSVAGGVPFQMLKAAREAGLSGDPAKIEAFTSALKGNPNFSGDAVDAIEAAVKDMEDAASRDYMSNQATAFGRTQPVDMTGPQNARNTVEGMITPSGAYGTPSPYNSTDIGIANRALDTIDNALTSPTVPPTIENLDQVKKAIGTLAEQIDNPTLKSRVQAIAGEMVTAMSNTDPAYGDMMSGWQKLKRELKNVKADFGTSATSDTARARRLQKALRSNSGALDVLEATPSGKNLRYSLAGDAMKGWWSDRIHNTIAGLGGLGGLGLAAAYHPAAALAAIPPIALASPKLGALSQYGLGKAERAVNKAAGKAAGVLTYSPALTNIASQYGAAREERKHGGRVSSHEADADQLVRAAERAKKGWSAKTEPLLNHSDEAVAKALEVANRSI